MELINVMEKSMNVPILQGECNSQWKQRLFYSGMGQWMLLSVWDKQTEVSIQHMKQRGETVFKGYLQSPSQEIDEYWVKKLVDYVYNIYLKTGQFYHKANYVLPAKQMRESCRDGVYLRGITLEDKCFQSGLGCYQDQSSQEGSLYPATMFHMETEPLATWWQRQIEDISSWNLLQLPEDVSCFSRHRKPGEGYWAEPRKVHEGVSLLRYGEKGVETYCLYRWDSGEILGKELSEWQVIDGAYYKYAIAIWGAEGVLPPVQATEMLDGAKNVAAYEITVGTILPPQEKLWYELYTWPTNWETPEDPFQKRLMSVSIYPAFRAVVQNLGYEIREV